MPPTPAPQPVEVIEVAVTLDKETVEGFNDARQIQFISGVADALGVSEAQIAIARVEPLGIDAARRRLADGDPIPGSTAMKLGIKVFLQIKMSKHSETASVITVMESPQFKTKLSESLKQQHAAHGKDHFESDPIVPGMGGSTPAAGSAGTLAVVDSSNTYDAGTV